jgi:hypothetical protein
MKLIRKETFTLKSGMFDLSATVTFRPDGKSVPAARPRSPAPAA